jgi:hypothetical protein
LANICVSEVMSFGEAFFILLAKRGVMPKEGLWMVYALPEILDAPERHNCVLQLDIAE